MKGNGLSAAMKPDSSSSKLAVAFSNANTVFQLAPCVSVK
jgi:hypothetical protein